MPEELVLDAAPAESGAIETTETPAVATDTTQETVDNYDTPQPGEVHNLRGSELFRAVKEKLKSTLDPQQYRALRNAIHIAGEADRATNGDLKAFQSERSAYSKLTDNPEDGLTPQQRVEQVLDERNFWRDFDGKFEKGDPEVLNQMFEANPNSFQMLVPQALSKLAEVNPDGYSTLIAQGIDGYLQSNEVYMQIAIASRFLPESSTDQPTQAVIDAFKAVKNAVGNIQHWAKQPLQAKKIEGRENPGGIDQNQDRLAEREHNIVRSEWNIEARKPNSDLYISELNRAATARKVTFTEQEKSKIMTDVIEEFNTRLAGNQLYGQAMRGYITSGNKRAYMDRVSSEGKKMLPSIVARHANAVIDARPKAGTQQKTQASAQPQKIQRQAAPQNNGNQATQWISGHPRTLNMQIDYGRTTNGMLQRNQAYIKGQKTLVQWKPRTA
jgi:hypothetical protein